MTAAPVVADHTMCIVAAICLFFIVRRNRICSCAAYFTKFRILICCTRNQRHIAGCHVMFRIRQTIWICKMCSRTTQFLCFRIHHVYELVHTATANMFTNSPCTFIGRFQHHTVQTVLHRHFFTDFSGNVRGIALIFINSLFRKGNDLIQITIFQCQKCCHYFCNTRWIIRNADIIRPILCCLYIHRTHQR